MGSLNPVFRKHERSTAICPIWLRGRPTLGLEPVEDFDPIMAVGSSKHVTSLQATARTFELDA
jgi:hypothetical protein